MVSGTTLGKEKPDGTVYYINMPSFTLDDIFDKGLFNRSWDHVGEYSVCYTENYFSLERFDMDRTHWRVLFRLDGSTQIRENDMTSGVPKGEPSGKSSPFETQLEPMESLDIQPMVLEAPVVQEHTVQTVHTAQTVQTVPMVFVTADPAIPTIPASRRRCC